MKKIFQRGGCGIPSFFIRSFTFLVNGVIFVLGNEFNSFFYFLFSVKYWVFIYSLTNFLTSIAVAMLVFFLMFFIDNLSKSCYIKPCSTLKLTHFWYAKLLLQSKIHFLNWLRGFMPLFLLFYLTVLVNAVKL